MTRIDGYLSRLSQEIDRRALVRCEDDPPERWWLEIPGEPDMGLGGSFSAAQAAVHAWVRAERARRSVSDE